jgi:nicotinamidase-related amidase
VSSEVDTVGFRVTMKSMSDIDNSPNPIDSPQTLPNWVLPWPSFEVDWNHAGLLIIDYQNYSSDPESGFARMLVDKFPEVAAYYIPRLTQVTIPNTRRLLDAFRKCERQVVFTRHGPLLPDGRDMIARRRKRDADSAETTERPTLWAKGSYEHEVIAELAPLEHELVLDKNAASAFNSSAIDQMLRNLRIESLVITGMATDMCVETTARDAADRGFNVIVVEDAVATFDPEHHRHALSSLARVFGQVWSTDQVLEACR